MSFRRVVSQQSHGSSIYDIQNFSSWRSFESSRYTRAASCNTAFANRHCYFAQVPQRAYEWWSSQAPQGQISLVIKPLGARVGYPFLKQEKNPTQRFRVVRAKNPGQGLRRGRTGHHAPSVSQLAASRRNKWTRLEVSDSSLTLRRRQSFS